MKLIAMQNNLGQGHKGDIILTTQERVDAEEPMIAKSIIDKKYAMQLVNCYNAFEKDGLVDELMDSCKAGLGAMKVVVEDSVKTELSIISLYTIRKRIKQIKVVLKKARIMRNELMNS